LEEKPKASPLPKTLSEQEKEKLKRRREYENLVRVMGVDPENGWQAHYVILPDKRKILQELKKAAAEAEEIYLATDLDREGEAIAWHLREAIGGDLRKYRRVTFSEITRPAIQQAFAQPGDLNMQRVQAQQTRRFLDRVVGYMLSPLLWKKIARGLSAGRVQSVAVRLIVEREREIHAFVPEEYWELYAILKAELPFRARVTACRGEKFEPKSRDEIDAALAILQDAEYVVQDYKVSPVKQNPYPPFITSTLQQAAFSRLGFSTKKTMALAQQLYQEGHITYMRTDSRNISAEALAACREYIRSAFGEKYLPATPNYYQSGPTAQEAHEAIRPTDVSKGPGSIASLNKDAARLYELIWRQFVACQMPPAEFDRTTIAIGAGDYELKATGSVLRFDGWMKVLPPQKSEENQPLPHVEVGQKLNLVELDPQQHFTKPPARYTEASLVKELEKRGIGRPSTYASIISTIQERGYVQLKNRRFYAMKIGEIVTDRLMENFQNLMDYDFTAGMETGLDEIAQGNRNWRQMLDDFYADFKKRLTEAEQTMRRNEPLPVNINCPNCGRQMVVRTGATGVFLSCSGYEKAGPDRCTRTLNLIPAEESTASGDEDEGDPMELLQKKRCPICGSAMDGWLVDESRRLYLCGNSPDCPGSLVETGKFRLKGYDGPELICERCGTPMQLKTGRFGKFFACTNSECKNTRKLLRNGQPAPPVMKPIPMPECRCTKSADYFLLREGQAGLFMAASTFPKLRETRAPLVEELARHRNELEPRFHYLADAPQSDPDGNPAAVKFDRKTRTHYLASAGAEKSGWKAYWENGNWKWQK
ncbi:MAG: type I DNA topoisomerase, partial [candidate division KSB1 bacterium]|nr:type I DNA topoisomerase [candidate division KSB1 bacterium]